MANSLVIREAVESDAPELKRLGDAVLTETAYFHRLPQERAATNEDMAMVIAAMAGAPRSAYLTAWRDGTAIGEAVLLAGQLQRLRHSGTVGVGVLARCARQGVGRRLMEAVEARAQEAGISRLELTVMVDNQPAISLYQALGYRVEGRKSGSVLIDGSLKDEFLMAKRLTLSELAQANESG